MLLSKPLERMIRWGRLTIIDADGNAHLFEGEAGPDLTIRFADKRLEWELLVDADLKVGEAYMDERLIIEEGDLYTFPRSVPDQCAKFATAWDFTGLGSVLPEFGSPAGWRKAIRSAKPSAMSPTITIYRANSIICFLDDQREYTCAYYPTGDETIDEAQRAKEQLVASKLLLEPGLKVADLGCGWGALGLFLAQEWDVDVTGVTLSKGTTGFCPKTIQRAMGLEQRVRFELKDYRQLDGENSTVSSRSACSNMLAGNIITNCLGA